MSDDSRAGPSVQLCAVPRGETDELRVSLDTFNGKQFISLRVWFKSGEDGRWLPHGKRGITVKLRELPAVLKALSMATEILNGARKAASP